MAHSTTTSTVGATTSTGTRIASVASCRIVIGLAFVTTEDGYVLVDTCSRWLDVEATHDGGLSWQEISRVQALSNSDTFDAARAEDKVAFVSKRVGVVQPGNRTLLVTDDGARSWRKQLAPAVLSDLFTSAGRIWAVTSCSDGACRGMVAPVSTAGFGTWRLLPAGTTTIEPAAGTWMIGGLRAV
ncbi:MAG TPA: hypothetical protein VEH29_16160 [Acidimicrobiales bacterium]|nr:hypothetical protein [Acidimicrobiales bacterium]